MLSVDAFDEVITMPMRYSAAVTAPRASELAIWTDALTDKGGDRGEILLSIPEFPEHKIALPGLPISEADCGKAALPPTGAIR
jgi:hypothetical protein